MLHDILSDYLAHVERAVSSCADAYVEKYMEEIISPERVNLRIRIRFQQGHMLELNEAVIVETDSLVSLDYRYHCQDENNLIIFRYDSTPHYPDLPTHPHHKHIPDRVMASEKPDIGKIIQEAKKA
jgi:hypothetical protein